MISRPGVPFVFLVAALAAFALAGCKSEKEGSASSGGKESGKSSDSRDPEVIACDEACASARDTCEAEGNSLSYRNCFSECNEREDEPDSAAHRCLLAASTCEEARACREQHWSDEPEEESAPSSASSFHHRFVEAYCDRKHDDCCSSDESNEMWSSASDPPSRGCRYELRSEPMSRAVEKSAEAGRLGYEPDQALACLEKTRQLGCEAFNMERASRKALLLCSDVLVPQVETGGDCLLDLDCKSELCSGEDVYRGRLGSCTEPKQGPERKEGDECYTFKGGCGDGLYCKGESGPGKGACAPLESAGAPCSEDSHCKSHWCEEEEGEKVCRGPVCDGA